MNFLSSLPPEQCKTVRGEDLVADPNEGLRSLTAWLGVRTDPDAVEEMRHPEKSPYACLGPSSASFGSDVFLRKGPLVRPEWARPQSLEGPLGWSKDDEEFSLQVRLFAQRLGYM